MSPLRTLMGELHDGEVELEKQLHLLAERHRTDHEVRHVAIDLARWSLQNRQVLALVSGAYGDPLADDLEPAAPPGAVEKLREKTSELVGRQKAPGLLLLRDLRETYLKAHGNATLWTMLLQGAKATRDQKLADVVTTCQERTTRQAVWCNAMMKVLSAHVLAAAEPGPDRPQQVRQELAPEQQQGAHLQV